MLLLRGEPGGLVPRAIIPPSAVSTSGTPAYAVPPGARKRRSHHYEGHSSPQRGPTTSTCGIPQSYIASLRNSTIVQGPGEYSVYSVSNLLTPPTSTWVWGWFPFVKRANHEKASNTAVCQTTTEYYETHMEFSVQRSAPREPLFSFFFSIDFSILEPSRWYLCKQ